VTIECGWGPSRLPGAATGRKALFGGPIELGWRRRKWPRSWPITTPGGGPMATVSNAAPLIALDAVVIDTETTGLDPGKARIVEIAALPLVAGKLDKKAALRRLVNPGEPIPPTATQIHHID